MGAAIKNITIDRAVGFTWNAVLQNSEDESPFDLTGYTAMAKVREEPGSNKVIVEMTATINVPTSDGGITITIPEEDTIGLPTGVFHWDLVIRSDTAPDIKLLKGKVTIEDTASWEGGTQGSSVIRRGFSGYSGYSGVGLDVGITDNLVQGDGDGNVTDSGIDPNKVVSRITPLPTSPSDTAGIIALMEQYGLCGSTPPIVKLFPRGIVSLFPADTITDPIGDLSGIDEFTNANVDGMRYRGNWEVLQTGVATFNWTTTDQLSSLCHSHGKFFGLSISAGISTPGWVFTAGAQRYDLVDGSGESMPVPWDPTFLSIWIDNFVAALAAKYESDSALRYVVVGGFSQKLAILAGTEDESNLNALAVGAGYANVHDAWQYAARTIITGFINAFPTTSIILTTTPPFSDGRTDVRTLKDWGWATYPRHFGTVNTSLFATPSPHGLPPELSYNPQLAQCFAPCSNNPACYAGSPPSPFPADPTPLSDCLGHAVEVADHLVEVYRPDTRESIAQSTLADYGDRLAANVPTGL